MRRAERVVDVGVDPLDQLATNFGSLRLLARVEAQVLQQLDAGGQLGKARPTGSIEYFGSGSPFGRPRWLTHMTTSAPRSVSHSIVGNAARMRKSSVIVRRRRAGR